MFVFRFRIIVYKTAWRQRTIHSWNRNTQKKYESGKCYEVHLGPTIAELRLLMVRLFASDFIYTMNVSWHVVTYSINKQGRPSVSAWNSQRFAKVNMCWAITNERSLLGMVLEKKGGGEIPLLSKKSTSSFLCCKHLMVLYSVA